MKPGSWFVVVFLTGAFVVAAGLVAVTFTDEVQVEPNAQPVKVICDQGRKQTCQEQLDRALESQVAFQAEVERRFADIATSGNDPGPSGLNGLDGTDGIDGLDGRAGRDGIDGIDGSDGRDGIDGADGVDGTNGTDGADGQPGADGQDGEPPDSFTFTFMDTTYECRDNDASPGGADDGHYGCEEVIP